MGRILPSYPAKLIVGFIFKEEAALLKAEAILNGKFGQIDFQSKALPFTHTHYYDDEFGLNLKRAFISFKKLILPEKLVNIKLMTNSIEKRLSQGPLRTINIDPGYLELSKLVLASTKDYSHRIYLGRGIYAEVTLLYQRGSFRGCEWTYPDYKSQEYIAIFNQIRKIYAQQIK